MLSAPNAEEALLLCQEQHPHLDLLLTDVAMPGMHGPELARHILELYPGLPVLFTSGYTRNYLVLQGVKEAELEFLQKPYTAKLLLEKLRDVLARHAPGGQSPALPHDTSA